MDTVLSVLSSVFWGLLMLSVLVFLHEGGHFLAARACGVRVTEFFLGLPCRFDIHYTSRRIGTKFGVTPLLLGGYAAICGMDPTDVSCADRVLAAIYRHGRVTVADLAAASMKDMGKVVQAVLAALGKPESLIEHVQDRKGHDMRYAIDPTKIHNELGWLPETMFKDGIRLTIQWYLDHKEWWENIVNGEYQNYYKEMYGKKGI